MYLVMKSVTCSMYILVFFEYSNSIRLSPSYARPGRRGPQPRDGLPRALPSVLIARQRLERREEHRSRHPPDRHLDQHGAVHLDRVRDELTHLAGLLRAPAHRAVRLGEADEVGVVQLGRELSAPVLFEVARDVTVGVVV